MRTKTYAACAVLVCCGTLLAGCPTWIPVLRLVFDQGTPGEMAYLSEADRSVFFDVEAQMGDDFSLPEGDSNVTHVTWWGVYSNNEAVTDDFTLTIYRDNGMGMPDTGGYWEHRAAETATRTETTGFVEPGLRNLRIYRYRCEVEGWNFDPDTTYYLSVVNETASGTWMWCVNGSDSEGNNILYTRSSWGDAWTSHTGDMAFRLHSDQ
jgi:hypothetical protein